MAFTGSSQEKQNKTKQKNVPDETKKKEEEEETSKIK